MPARHKTTTYSLAVIYYSLRYTLSILRVRNTLVCSFQPFILCLSIPYYSALCIFLAIHFYSQSQYSFSSLYCTSANIFIAVGILSSQVHNGSNAPHQSLLCLGDPFSTVQPAGIFYIPSAALGYRISCSQPYINLSQQSVHTASEPSLLPFPLEIRQSGSIHKLEPVEISESCDYHFARLLYTISNSLQLTL